MWVAQNSDLLIKIISIWLWWNFKCQKRFKINFTINCKTQLFTIQNFEYYTFFSYREEGKLNFDVKHIHVNVLSKSVKKVFLKLL